jgi:hypothetical protein
MERVQALGGSDLRILARANSEGVLEGRLVTHPYIGIGTMVGVATPPDSFFSSPNHVNQFMFA